MCIYITEAGEMKPAGCCCLVRPSIYPGKFVPNSCSILINSFIYLFVYFPYFLIMGEVVLENGDVRSYCICCW